GKRAARERPVPRVRVRSPVGSSSASHMPKSGSSRTSQPPGRSQETILGKRPGLSGMCIRTARVCTRSNDCLGERVAANVVAQPWNRPRLVRCAESSSRRSSSKRAVDQMSETRQPEPEVRLAELVAALSLGVDLGFGQPMEHVLRECMIALRLADRLRLNEKERSTVYYNALLVDVGCHSDAHQQAQW